MDRITRHRTTQVSLVISQMGVEDFCRALHQTTDYTLFSYVYRISSRVDHLLSQTNLHEIQKNEVKQRKFSHPNGMKLEISDKMKFGKFTKTEKVNNIQLNKTLSQGRNHKECWKT